MALCDTTQDVPTLLVVARNTPDSRSRPGCLYFLVNEEERYYPALLPNAGSNFPAAASIRAPGMVASSR
jgi:hypothetical protein